MERFKKISLIIAISALLAVATIPISPTLATSMFTLNPSSQNMASDGSVQLQLWWGGNVQLNNPVISWGTPSGIQSTASCQNIVYGYCDYWTANFNYPTAGQAEYAGSANACEPTSPYTCYQATFVVFGPSSNGAGSGSGGGGSRYRQM